MPSRKDVLPVKDFVVDKFTAENWNELGIITECDDLIGSHPRLLRSLSFGDDDYGGHALNVLVAIAERAPDNWGIVQEYLVDRFTWTGGGLNVSSTKTNSPRIYFTPGVFIVPESPPNPKLVSLMMPFSGDFRSVYAAIKAAAEGLGLSCQRADDIWEDSVVIQDIFSLVYRSRVVVCDFSGKNPNVFYEAGIAHTLGKHVIPIVRNAEDIPFDLRHHRYLTYLNNEQGLQDLQRALAPRLQALTKDTA